MRRWFTRLMMVWLLFPAAAIPAYAQQQSGSSSASLGWDGWGVRVGASSDPDQVFGGVHFDLGEFAPDVRFRPSLEIGTGDDATVFQFLAEAHYVFSKVQVWKPYLGGGVGLTYVDFDSDLSRRLGDDSESDIALVGLGGIETRLKSATSFFLELKIGLGDSDPDLKLAVGWGWR
jgi:opacity protein-like surface antigen